MDKIGKETCKKSMTRREVVRIGGAVTTCASLFAGFVAGNISLEAAENQVGPQNQAPPNHSVFEDSCRNGNKGKYQQYDSSSIYPVIAFWLMLTTDEWGTCLADPDWRKRLATELNMLPDHLEDLYCKSLTLADSFSKVKKMWQAYILQPPSPPKAPYGARPCPGGKTLLQIAGLNESR
jgi:hypothetical protein